MNSRSVLCFICVISLSFNALAQKENKVFLDSDFKVLKSEKRAAYYQIQEGIGRKRDFEGKVTRYTLDGKRLQFVFMKDGMMEGSFMSFNLDDFTSIKGQYIADNKVGSWYKVDTNGDYVEEVIYAFSGDEQKRINLITENEVYYEETDIPASYDQGNAAWNQYLRKSLRYPIELKIARITGKLEIHFRITKLGKFKGYHVVDSPHPTLTESIVRTVLNSGKWQGALKSNQLVNSIFVYRSTYNIQDLRK